MTDRDPRPLNPEISRRRFIQGTTLAGFSAFLVACGTSGTGTKSASASASAPASTAPSVGPTASSGPQSPSAE